MSTKNPLHNESNNFPHFQHVAMHLIGCSESDPCLASLPTPLRYCIFGVLSVKLKIIYKIEVELQDICLIFGELLCFKYWPLISIFTSVVRRVPQNNKFSLGPLRFLVSYQDSTVLLIDKLFPDFKDLRQNNVLFLLTYDMTLFHTF